MCESDNLRSIRESNQFHAEKLVIEKDARRFDEMMEGAIWVIVHKLDAGAETDMPGVYALPLWPPGIVVYYAFDDEYIDLLSVVRA